jgi:hypothetical protein
VIRLAVWQFVLIAWGFALFGMFSVSIARWLMRWTRG